MKCPKCCHENEEGARFCEECAAPLQRACAKCGRPLSPTAKFCPGCAHPTAPSPETLGSTAWLNSPDSYTPKHLVEKILTSKTALEGERKQVTVLFADLKGSMELLADRNPEEARKLLDPVIERMMEAVHRYEGTVNQVMGDGIMALFGAPLAHEDHAVRACYAALRMQEAVRRYSDELRRTQGVEVQIRVGVNSGDVVVRSIGSDLRMDYTAVGQTTHLAARMEQLASPGSIRLTAGTQRLAEGFVEVASLGPVPVKGLPETVETFELQGVGAARTRLEATAERGLTRFVGRGAEMEQIRDALDWASLGRGQVVAMVGEPGVGKSRLVWEVIHSPVIAGWRVLKASSVSYGKATSYLPVIDLLKGYFGIEDRDGLQEVGGKVTGGLLRLDRSLEPAVVPLLALLDMPVSNARWETLDPRQRRRSTLDAIRQLLLCEARNQPLLLIFEDLHWIDGETQAVLDSLVESLPAARVLLLVNYRPEYGHAWGGKTYYRQLRIDPLPPESADELLDALLGDEAALVPLKRFLIARTESVPLFLEESVRSMVETGALDGAPGDYRLTRPIDQLRLPATVQAILAARIDRLTPEAKRLLQAAAVIGKEVPLPLLLAIADAPEHEVRPELTRLQAAEFLYEVRLFPDLEYTFKHALTHEVAYQGLLQDRQRTLHSRITEAVERLPSERVAEQVERLAHHALRGELWEKAVSYLRQAGLRAIARGASREAFVHLEQALVALRRLPETQATTELATDIHVDLRNALFPLADWARIEDHLHEAEVLARRLGDQHRIGRIATFMVMQRRITGEYNESLRYGQEALRIARTVGDRSIEVMATSYLATTQHFKGAFSDAVTLVERNVALLKGDLRFERFGTTSIWSAVNEMSLAHTLPELGRFDEAIEHAEAAVRTGEAADYPFTRHVGLHMLGAVHLLRGDFPRAIPFLQQCVDLGRTWQFADQTGNATAALGAAYALTGRTDEALAVVADLVEKVRSDQKYIRPYFFLRCGDIYLSAGQIEEAARHAREALALSRRLGTPGWEAHALCLTGAVAATTGAEDPQGYYHPALTLAEPRGMRPLVAHCHLGLGKLYRRTGNREQAKEHLTIATAMYREMAMTYWLEQVEGETALLAPANVTTRAG
jgi:class 3 adenylate cyclase/tetratricopeptide (TPR) repeat protein